MGPLFRLHRHEQFRSGAGLARPRSVRLAGTVACRWARNDVSGVVADSRAVANSAGPWDEALSLGDDGEYFTRVLLAAERVLFCPGARCYYRSALPGSLSGRKSAAAWASQFRVIELCEYQVRAREDSERVRRGFALSWQHLAHACYPYEPALADRALMRGRALHAVRIRPGGGSAFKVLSRIIGWRAARRLQVASGRP